jgi:cell division protein FtsI/penicillin-binding protein 2
MTYRHSRNTLQARPPRSLSAKVNKVLHLVWVALLLIGVRSWHLAVVQHERGVEEARRPRHREVLQRAERGTIRDRFNIPLALNEVQFNASVVYADIRQLPARAGKRRAHVRNLSEYLAGELGLDVDRVEDLIHSKAALFPNTPFVIESDISEEQYFRLKGREREWLGLAAERVARRVYPQGKVGCDIVGYMGAISAEEYRAVADEMVVLGTYLRERDEGNLSPLPPGVATPMEARNRLRDLRERAYTMNDQVGKYGVESTFDEQLRGFHGHKTYQADIYGTYVRELPAGHDPIAGQRLMLTLSSELQAYAEQLLAQSERIRDGHSAHIDRQTRAYTPLPQPWIKGGAIVAMEPNTGEVLALATFPRFDPNDFVTGSSLDRLRWLEHDSYLAAVWEGRESLRRENFSLLKGGFYEESVPLTWDQYLRLAFGEQSDIAKQAAGMSVAEAVELQQGEDQLLADLAQVAVDPFRLPAALLEEIGEMPISHYFALSQSALQVHAAVEELARELFHEHYFIPWRRENEKSFLKAKRAEEKSKRRGARPYLDYLDSEERRQFHDFWRATGWQLTHLLLFGGEMETPVASALQVWSNELRTGAHRELPWREAYDRLQAVPPSCSLDLLRSFRRWSELDRPLFGTYRYMRRRGDVQTEQDLASAFYPRYGHGYGRSHAFRQAATLGSIFKVVIAYEAIRQREERGEADLNPFTMVEEVHRGKSGWNMGYTASGRPIPQLYKGGKLMATQRRNVGRIDITQALEVSANPYLALLTVDHMEDVEDPNRAAASLGFGEKSGIELPGEYRGHLPDDLATNRTGLYAYASGQHTLVATPLQTATMLSTIANGGTLLEPHIAQCLAGREPEREVTALFNQPRFAHADTLSLLGIDLPLFTASETAIKQGAVTPLPPHARRDVPLGDETRQLLLEGMRRVTQGERGGARPSAVRGYQEYPWMVQDYRRLHDQIVGKTSTAEAKECVTLDPNIGVNTYNHIWFGGVAFESDQIKTTNSELIPYRFETPELVVVVYLRYGNYGREVAPLAGQMIKRWREIRSAAERQALPTTSAGQQRG